MATFGVEITGDGAYKGRAGYAGRWGIIYFASDNTGYKDITIVNMPAAGVSLSITGSNRAKFGYRMPGSDQNVYRVYTTGTNSGSSTYVALLTITNAGDSSDKIEIEIEQLYDNYVPGISRGTILDVIVDNPTMINLTSRDGSTSSYQSYYTYLYVNYNKGDYSTAKCTLLLNGGYTIPTSADLPNWVSIVSDTTLSDTGFKRVYVSFVNNYDGPREALIYFGNPEPIPSGSAYTNVVDYQRGWTLIVRQDGYPSSTVGCTDAVTISQVGGSFSTYVRHSSGASPVVKETPGLYGPFSNNFNVSSASTSGTNSTFDVTVSSTNYTSTAKKGYMPYFYNSTSASDGVYLGHTVITQEGTSPTPTLSVDQSELVYPSTGGGRVLNVTYAYPLTTNESSAPSWLDISSVNIDISNKSYTISADYNDTTIARNFDLELADATMSLVVPINQSAGGPTSLSLDPISNSVTSSSGVTYVTVTGVGVSTITYNISDTTWLNYRDKWNDTYYFRYNENTGVNQRTNTIVFSGNGGASATYTLTQAGAAPSLTVSPTVQEVGRLAGTVSVTVSGNMNISYTISDNWLTYVSDNNGTYTFSYPDNDSSVARQSVVTFSGAGLSRTYTLTQRGVSSNNISTEISYKRIPNGGGGGGGITVYYDGSYTVSKSSWISGSSSGSSSTGTSVWSYSVGENTAEGADMRVGYVTFTGDNGSSCTVDFYQGGMTYNKVPQISPTSLVFPGEGGDIIMAVDYYSELSYSGIPYWITKTVLSGDESGTAPVILQFSAGCNATSSTRTATIRLTGGDSSSLRHRDVTASQVTGQTPEIAVSPTTETVDHIGGSVQVTVSSIGVNTITYNISNSWLSYYEDSGGVYTFIYPSNTGAERTATVTFSGNGASATYTLVQQAGSTVPYLNVSPTSTSVSYGSGTASTYVVATNITNLTFSVSEVWLTYSYKDGNTYYFNYLNNPNTSARSAIVTFTGGGLTKTFTVNQTAYNPGPAPEPTPQLKAYPKTLKFKCEGGTIVEGFKKYPTAGVSYTITYTDGSGWLSVAASGDGMAVTASANTGSRRRATIRFYETGNSGNYVDVPVIQGSTSYYESIWMDVEYRPSDWDISNQRNYYYGLLDQDTNSIFFRGVAAIPEGWGGVTAGCIDIPRIVEDYIGCSFNSSASNSWGILYGSIVVDFYNLNVNPAVVVDTFKYWNDWSRCVERYDYTRYLNDPINGKGCTGMAIPVCVYYDDAATFRVVDNETSGSVQTYTLPTPTEPFVQMWSSYYGTDRLDFKQDNDIIFSYDLRHCGKGAFIYKNRFGGYDSFLIEGNIIKTDNYDKLNLSRNGLYNSGRSLRNVHYLDEKYTDTVNINTTYEVHTGWLSDEESERLAFHLLSSPEVYFQDLDWDRFDYNDRPLKFDRIRLTNTSTEYKKFRNGRQLVKYTITFEMSDIQRVRR